MTIGSVCLNNERAAPSSRSSINSMTICMWKISKWSLSSSAFVPFCISSNTSSCLWTYLFVEIDQLFVWQFECLDGSEDSVPVAVVDVGHKSILRVDGVQRHRSFILKSLIDNNWESLQIHEGLYEVSWRGHEVFYSWSHHEACMSSWKVKEMKLKSILRQMSIKCLLSLSKRTLKREY